MSTPAQARAAIQRFINATGWYVADSNSRNGRCDLSLTPAQLDVITDRFLADQAEQHSFSDEDCQS